MGRPKKPPPPGPPTKTKRPYKPLTPQQQLKAKQRRARYKRLHPFRPPRILTTHDLLYKAFKQSNALEVFHFLRTHGTNIERLLVNNGYDRRLAKFLSARDALLLTASQTGLKLGHIALTLPEQLVIQWLEYNHYSFGGVYPNQVTNPNADFFSQYPLEGGRSAAGGGLVADIFIAPLASRTTSGVVLAVDGNYYHSKQNVSGRDAAQNTLLQSKGYTVARITDTEIYQHGTLEAFMRGLLGYR